MTFLILLAMAEFLLFLLMISIGVLICGIEKAFTESKRLEHRERTEQQTLSSIQEHREQLRQIRSNCEQIEADIYLRNQLHYWPQWNKHNDLRNMH